MGLNFNQRKHELHFLPLGGSGEIGMNLNLYHYKGKWLIVDCGAGFAEDFMPGVDMIVPDVRFIKEIKEHIVGMVLTHAHEDHCGAVQYVWDEFECPIYTTPFTSAFLKAKLSESGVNFANRIPIHEVQPGSSLEVGPFNIDLVALTHSTPEMHALLIRTEYGNIFHTGDWKFDHDPLIGEKADEDLLRRIGDEGVLALVGDSTNVFKEGESGSEGDLRKSLTEIIGKCSQLVAVATFASNVARIETVAHAAQAHGKKIVLAGRSLWRIVQAARSAGYLTDVEFLDDRQAAKYPRKNLVILCTGCQGEPLAVTNKLASGAHPNLKLLPGDTVIFASKIIPGNDKKIFRLFNKFVKLGIEVITEKDHFVHVSGHPGKAELKRMYELVRPEIAIPVHGEHVHMHEHAKDALKWGVKHSIEVENGVVVRLAPGTAEKIGMVDAGFLGIDGYYLLAPDSHIMKTRRKIQHAGIVLVTLLLDSRDRLITDPIIKAPGSLDPQEDLELVENMITEIRHSLLNDLKAKGRKKPQSKTETIGNLTRSVVRRFLRAEVGKEPVIDVHVEWVN